MCAHAGVGALGSTSLLPVTRQPCSCDDAGPLYLCIFSQGDAGVFCPLGLGTNRLRQLGGVQQAMQRRCR